MERQAWADAAAAFEDALAAKATPGLHYYLGVCLEQQGHHLEARSAYIAGQELLREQPAADVAALLPSAIERVEARLSRLELVVSPEGALVRIDGALWKQPSDPWLTPGRHLLRVEAQGHQEAQIQVQAVAGVATRLVVSLQPLPFVTSLQPANPASSAPLGAREGAVVAAPPPKNEPLPPVEPPARDSALPRSVFWTSVALGVVGTAAGVAGVIWRADASARIEAADAELGPSDDSACYGPADQIDDACRDLRAAVSNEESATMLMVGGFGMAGLGVIGAVVSWAIWPSEKFAVRGRVGLGSAGIELSGHF